MRFPTSLKFVAPLALLAVVPLGLVAQSVSDHVALGDKDHKALASPSALRHYEEAIRADPASYEALWKASREAVDVSEFNADAGERERLYALAEQYARRAVEANPLGAEGHFNLARALGRKALTLGKRDQVKYATDVRRHALDALTIDPRHPGALHVMGMWNYNVMRLSGLTRMFAKAFLGGAVFGAANWDDAQRYMEEAAAVDPTRIVHHLDLARVYVARGNKDKAREQYETALRAPITDYNDRRYQAEAADEIKDVR